MSYSETNSSIENVSPDLKNVTDFLKQVEGKANEVDVSQVADCVSDVVVALRENKYVGKLIESWNGLSYEEQRQAAHADQGVLGRLFGAAINVVPFAPGKIGEIKASFLKSMLYYGVIEFKHEGTPEEHEALIKELHLNDQTYAKWIKLLLKGVGIFVPEALPLVTVLDQLENLLEMHGDFSVEIRSAVHRKIMKVVEEVDVYEEPLAA